MRLPSECSSLDSMLEGGFESGVISLVFGEAGTGKTNLALQLARSCARGDKIAIYIDGEGVSGDRLGQLFRGSQKALLKKVLFHAPQNMEEQMLIAEELEDFENLDKVDPERIEREARV